MYKVLTGGVSNVEDITGLFLMNKILTGGVSNVQDTYRGRS